MNRFRNKLVKITDEHALIKLAHKIENSGYEFKNRQGNYMYYSSLFERFMVTTIMESGDELITEEEFINLLNREDNDDDN